MVFQISPEAMADAKSSVVAAGRDYETAAKYPEVTLTDASTAQSALEDLGAVWANRLDRDVTLVEAVGSAFVMVGQAMRDADSDMKSHLERNGYTEDEK